MAKTINIQGRKGYDWKFSTVGGVTRVNIETGEDIAHLDELDQKLWTVLSCPVKGLEFDERTLALMDADQDGKIRVSEVIAASQWLKKVLRDMNGLTQSRSSISFDQVQSESDEGRQVIEAAQLILSKLGVEKQEISLQDVQDYMAVYEEKCRAEYTATNATPYEPPYGEQSDAAMEAINAVRAKMDDYFMRCRLVEFDADATAALDVQVEKIAAISGENLAENMAEIAAYPLQRPQREAVFCPTAGVNPAWQGAVSGLLGVVFPAECTAITEADWADAKSKVDAYAAWKAEGETAMNEAIAAQLETHAAAIAPVERLLHYCRDYFTLLQNYVLMSDFYRRDESRLAVFQAGKLFIDQRQCDLCIRVSDMGKQAAMAGASGMYLIYCHCVSKTGAAEMDIVAALTNGDVDNLFEGKNAIFYDRAGHDYDAVVTKIIDNPISVRQAFLSPYRKFGKWVTDRITKSATEKESQQFDNMTARAEGTSLTAPAADGAAAEKKPAFDIAKFAGIFAAIGLAVGAIGAALGVLCGFIFSKWYNILLIVVLVVVVISGPSMLLAWMKLRRRNLGPILNANGWAINSKIKVNTTFGRTLTKMASYPKVVGSDPFAEKKTPAWVKVLLWVVVLGGLAFGVLAAMHKLPWQKQAVAEVVEAAAAPVEAVEPAAEAAETPVAETAEE